MANYSPVTWINSPSTATPVSATNLNTMEDRLELIDQAYQMLGGTAATYAASIGASLSFLSTDGTSPRWRTPAQARTDLGLVIGTNVQAFNDALAAIAALTGVADRGVYFTGATTAALFTLTSAARNLLDDATHGDMRNTLGLGTIATQDASSVNITGGTIAGVTTADLGTVNAASVTTTGNLSVGGQGGSPLVTLTDGATLAPDGSQGNNFMVTVGGNRTMSAVTNQIAGFIYTFLIKKSGSGRTITWNSAYKFPGGIDAQLSSGSNPDLFSFLSDGTSLHYPGKNLS